MPVENSFAWRLDQFHGGNSDNPFLGHAASVQSVKGIDVRRFPRTLKLAHLMKKDSGAETQDLGLAMVTIKSTGDKIFFGDTGRIERKESGGSWSLVYVMSGNERISNALEFNDFLYWTTNANVVRIAISDIDGDWTGDVNETYKTFLNGAAQHPMMEKNNRLYFGDTGVLAELNSGVFTDDKIAIFGDEEISHLTEEGKDLRIYARKTTNVQHGKCYLWNGVDDAYNEIVDFGKRTIHGVISNGSIDFVMAGKPVRIYMAAGLDFQPARVLTDLVQNDELLFNTNCMDIFDGFTVIGVGKGSGISIGRGIWTFGAITKDFQRSLAFEYPTSNDNTTDEIGSVHESNGDLYMTWKDGDDFGIDKLNFSEFFGSGELVSLALTGSKVRNIKNIQAIDSAFLALLAGEQIQVQTRINRAGAFNTIFTATNATHSTKLFEESLGQAISDQNFHILEIKIIIKAGTNNLTTPQFFDIQVEYSEEQGR